MDILRKAYNSGATDEYNRLATCDGKIEFSKVCAAIEKYSNRASVIYDIGCGPGRYTEHLLKQGHFVGCIDISEKSLELFENRTSDIFNNKILFKKVCCASELDWIDQESADIILLLGPMYHLTNIRKRKSVIEQCHRILRKNGHIISMFLSPFPILHPKIATGSIVLETIDNSNHIVTKTNFKGFTVPQYRCWPDEAIIEFDDLFTELETIHIDEVKIENKLNDNFKIKSRNNVFSHQYFVVYQKK